MTPEEGVGEMNHEWLELRSQLCHMLQGACGQWTPDFDNLPCHDGIYERFGQAVMRVYKTKDIVPYFCKIGELSDYIYHLLKH